MKKILPFLIFIFFNTYAIAQSNKQKIDSVNSLVVKYFNAKNADSLYALSGDAFKSQLSADQFKQICNNNLFPLGIMQTTFESNTSGINKYKAVFSTGTILALYVSLDDKDKLYTFLFKPYIDETNKKTSVATNNSLSSVLDKAVDSIVKPYITLAATCGLSIGVLKNNAMHFYGYGETTKGDKQIPDEHTLYEIGSITKTFTAILLADAVNNGKIKLDDPVNKYLPDSIPPLQYDGSTVTIEMLSNHSSGIPRMPNNFDDVATDSLNPYKSYDEQKLFSFYKTFKLNRKPGTQYEYSNLAAATLGIILEHVYHKSFEELVTEKICAPLRMNNTHQFISANDSARVATGYSENGEYNGPWDFEAFAPAGSLRSDAADMLMYAKANLGDAPSALNKDIQLTHVITFTDGGNKVALGWHYIKAGNDEILFHNGGTGGYRSYLGINLDKKIAVVILSNTAISVDDVGNELMKWMENN
ncbi:MAG TPA: serine hydrolase domain-containing protein [Parafilimonas sp.]|nr:serine hydrolase domain-containing protein [Parafilimonas sp.]